MVLTFPLVAIFTALGICQVARELNNTIGMTVNASRSIAVTLFAILAINSLHFYFFDYNLHNYFGGPNDEVALEAGLILGKAPRDSEVYFLGEPRMFYSYPSIPFLSHNLGGIDVSESADVEQVVERGRPAIFIAVPERKADMDHIRETFPGGEFVRLERKTVPGETLLMMYRVQL
jgi:hypothetical protein